MSYQYEFARAGDSVCIVVTWSGPLTVEGLDEVVADLSGHPDFRPNLNRLYDLRDATIDLSLDEIRSYVEGVKSTDETHGQRRVAVLVQHDVVFGIARMFASIGYTLKANMEVFRDEGEAKVWAGLPADFALASAK